MGVIRANQGFWGHPTSTIEWCEGNYEVTVYIAEFWNTISNLCMILPPIWSMIVSYRLGIESRFMLCYIFLATVGVGSWCFHMTLLYEMQLLDELPMVLGQLLTVYTLIPLIYPRLEKSFLVKIALIFYGLVLAAVYLIVKAPLLFQCGYASIALATLYFDIRILRELPCDKKLFSSACILFYTGFAIWNIDNIFCAQLTTIRGQLPLIFQPLTQFHALWHAFAGYGSYAHVAFCIQTRSMQRNQPVTYEWVGLTLKPARQTKSDKLK